MVGGEGDGQVWESGRGAIAGCHCSVLWLGASVTTNFGAMDVVPLQGAHGIPHSNGIQKKHLEKLLELLADVTLFCNTKLLFLLSGVYAGIIYTHTIQNNTEHIFLYNLVLQPIDISLCKVCLQNEMCEFRMCSFRF